MPLFKIGQPRRITAFRGRAEELDLVEGLRSSDSMAVSDLRARLQELVAARSQQAQEREKMREERRRRAAAARTQHFETMAIAGIRLGMSRTEAEAALRAHFGNESEIAPLTSEGSARLGRLVKKHWRDPERVTLPVEQRWPGLVGWAGPDESLESVLVLLSSDSSRVVAAARMIEYAPGTLPLEAVRRRFQERFAPPDEQLTQRGGQYWVTEETASDGARCVLPRIAANVYLDPRQPLLMGAPVVNDPTVSRSPYTYAACGRTAMMQTVRVDSGTRLWLWLSGSDFAERHVAGRLVGSQEAADVPF